MPNPLLLCLELVPLHGTTESHVLKDIELARTSIGSIRRQKNNPASRKTEKSGKAPLTEADLG